LAVERAIALVIESAITLAFESAIADLVDQTLKVRSFGLLKVRLL